MALKSNWKKIKELREARLLSQTALADMVGVTLRTVQFIEREGAGISFDTARRLADKLNVQPWEISDAPKGIEEVKDQGPVDVTFTLPHESIKTWSEEKRAAFIEGISSTARVSSFSIS